MKGVFITGTDTDVGKTYAAALLARERGWGYWKPAQTGLESDTATVARLAGCEVWDRGIRLPQPLSPHLAARLAGTSFTVNDVLAMAPRDGDWVVEGAGGVLVPLNERELMVDLMKALRLPVIVVARSTLGTINHTLLALEALRKREIAIETVLMMGENVENQKAIAEYGKVDVRVIPWDEAYAAS